jgi:hypothetical protein
MAALAYQIHDGPMVFASLEMVNGEFRQFSATQTTTK